MVCAVHLWYRRARYKVLPDKADAAARLITELATVLPTAGYFQPICTEITLRLLCCPVALARLLCMSDSKLWSYNSEDDDDDHNRNNSHK